MPRNFLCSLWPDGIAPYRLTVNRLVTTRPNQTAMHTAFFSTIDDAAAYIAGHKDENVWFGCGLRKSEYGEWKRGSREDIAAIPGLWFDLDLRAGEAHKQSDLPMTMEEGLSILAGGLPQPSIVIHSGYGLQLWWLFKEPWIFETAKELDLGEALLKAWGATLQIKGQECGWKFDNTADLPRILRPQGSWNHKQQGQPKPVLVIHDSGNRYNPDDFEAYTISKAVDVAAKLRTRRTQGAKWEAGAPEDAMAGNSDLDVIEANCAWMHHCKADGAKLSEPEWKAQMDIVVHCIDGSKRAHERSRSYPGYSTKETDAKIARALTVGPRTCARISEDFPGYCDNCPHTVTSPIILGKPEDKLPEEAKATRRRYVHFDDVFNKAGCAWAVDAAERVGAMGDEEWLDIVALVEATGDRCSRESPFLCTWAKLRQERGLSCNIPGRPERAPSCVEVGQYREPLCQACPHHGLIQGPADIDKTHLAIGKLYHNATVDPQRCAEALLKDTGTLRIVGGLSKRAFEWLKLRFRSAGMSQDLIRSLTVAARDEAKNAVIEQQKIQLKRTPEESNGKPIIIISNKQLNDIIEETWEVFLRCNVGADGKTPIFYQRENELVRIAVNRGGPVIESVSEQDIYSFLTRIINWVGLKSKDGTLYEAPVLPPRDIAKDIAAVCHPSIPRLDDVVTSPIFDAHGRFLGIPGYYPDAKVFYYDTGLGAMNLEEDPPNERIDWARRLIFEDLLSDFPFVANSDRAHVMSAMLTALVRRMIVGAVPIHLIEAPMPGSGKGLLADIFSIILCGKRLAPITFEEKNDEEIRKKITAILMQGNSLVLVDNVEGLDSGALSSLVTCTIWSDRKLGSSENINLPNNAVWMVTANNPSLSNEIARRCLRIRIDRKTEKPWTIKKFSHDPLRLWAMRHRGEYFCALATLVQAWIARGAQPGPERMASFEEYAPVISGILNQVGIPGFLASQEELYERSDDASQQWKAFVLAWAERYGQGFVSASELLNLADGTDDADQSEYGYRKKSSTPRYLTNVIRGHSWASRLASISAALPKTDGRVFGNYSICRSVEGHSKAFRYNLLAIERINSSVLSFGSILDRSFAGGAVPRHESTATRTRDVTIDNEMKNKEMRTPRPVSGNPSRTGARVCDRDHDHDDEEGQYTREGYPDTPPQGTHSQLDAQYNTTSLAGPASHPLNLPDRTPRNSFDNVIQFPLGSPAQKLKDINKYNKIETKENKDGG